MKTWISKRVFYFVGIFNRVGDIFLPGCPQVLFLLNIRFRSIFEPHKSLVKKDPLIDSIDTYTPIIKNSNVIGLDMR